MSKRIPTKYPGVFYRMADRIGEKGQERVYYVLFKKDGKLLEEKAGRQFVDNFTPAKAADYRVERIKGKRPSRKEIREQQKAAAEKAKEKKTTLDFLFQEYNKARFQNKSAKVDEGRFNKHIKPTIGDKEPRDILLLDIDRIRLKSLKGRKPQTVASTLGLIERIVSFGARRNLCSPLPFKIEKPKVSNLKTEYLTDEQMKALLLAIEKDKNVQAANLMKLALYTGMRRGELFKLKWEDVDFERGFISIRDPKGGVDQKIPLNDAARQVLTNHPREEKDVFVFPGRGGKQRVDINHQVKQIRDDAGLPASFRPLHGLRHSYASMLASSGQVDLYTIQKLLTHKSPKMTMRYAHLRDDALRKASNLAGQIVSDALKAARDEMEKKKADGNF
jgi:integrase